MKFNNKDLINVGIFTTFYLILAILVMSVGVTPFLQMITIPLFALLAAPIYLLYISKVSKFGAITSMGLICSAISGLLVFGSVLCFLACFIFFIIAELIAYIGKYKNNKFNNLSYIIASYWSIGVAGLPWSAKEYFSELSLASGYSIEWVQGVENLATTNVLIYVLIGTLICAIISVNFSTKLFKKHFKSAGII